MGVPPTIEYASLGMADSLILMVLALVVFGPRRLPQIGRQLGKLMYEFRKASNDFKFQMEEELRNAEEADRRKKEEERLRTMTLEAPKQPSTEPAEIAAVYNNPAESPAAYASEPEPNPYQTDDAAVKETTAEPQPPAETAPRIQPPSTGEPVGAERPGSPATEQPPADPTYYFSTEKETPGSPEVTEQATHNG